MFERWRKWGWESPLGQPHKAKERNKTTNRDVLGMEFRTIKQGKKGPDVKYFRNLIRTTL